MRDVKRLMLFMHDQVNVRAASSAVSPEVTVATTQHEAHEIRGPLFSEVHRDGNDRDKFR